MLHASTNLALPPQSHRQLAAPGAACQPEVLAVDDEPMILELVRACLQSEGFQVWTARSGTATIRHFQEHTAISVIILDWEMGPLDGTVLLDCLQAIRPGVPVIVTSGSCPDDVVRAFAGRNMVRFLRKPFKLADLVCSVSALAQCDPPSRSGRPLG